MAGGIHIPYGTKLVAATPNPIRLGALDAVSPTALCFRSVIFRPAPYRCSAGQFVQLWSCHASSDGSDHLIAMTRWASGVWLTCGRAVCGCPATFVSAMLEAFSGEFRVCKIGLPSDPLAYVVGHFAGLLVAHSECGRRLSLGL